MGPGSRVLCSYALRNKVCVGAKLGDSATTDQADLCISPQQDISRDLRTLDRRIRDRMIAGRMGIGFLKEVVTGQVPAGLKRLSINELAELVRDDARYSEPGLRREIYFRPHSPQRAKRRAPAGGTKSSNPSSSSGESANARSARGTNSPPALERARCVPAGFGPGQASSVAALRHSISGGVRGTGAGSAVDLALSCSACHSMEPRANTVLEGCGLRCSSAAFACRRMSSYKPQLCIWGLSISRAPLQASTSSSWERSGNPSRTRNNSSFQGPRRIFTLPARHCELNGPNLVSLPPFSGAGVAVKPLSARRRRGALVLRRYARRMIRARTMSSATLNGVAPDAAAQRSTPRVMAPMRATEASTAAGWSSMVSWWKSITPPAFAR